MTPTRRTTQSSLTDGNREGTPEAGEGASVRWIVAAALVSLCLATNPASVALVDACLRWLADRVLALAVIVCRPMAIIAIFGGGIHCMFGSRAGARALLAASDAGADADRPPARSPPRPLHLAKCLAYGARLGLENYRNGKHHDDHRRRPTGHPGRVVVSGTGPIHETEDGHDPYADEAWRQNEEDSMRGPGGWARRRKHRRGCLADGSGVMGCGPVGAKHHVEPDDSDDPGNEWDEETDALAASEPRLVRRGDRIAIGTRRRQSTTDGPYYRRRRRHDTPTAYCGQDRGKGGWDERAPFYIHCPGVGYEDECVPPDARLGITKGADPEHHGHGAAVCCSRGHLHCRERCQHAVLCAEAQRAQRAKGRRDRRDRPRS